VDRVSRVLVHDEAILTLRATDVQEDVSISIDFASIDSEREAHCIPGAAEIAEMFSYFQAHTYLGSGSRDQIVPANKIASRQPTEFSARANVRAPENAHSTAR
jgi:hypothetical protein